MANGWLEPTDNRFVLRARATLQHLSERGADDQTKDRRFAALVLDCALPGKSAEEVTAQNGIPDEALGLWIPVEAVTDVIAELQRVADQGAKEA